MPMKKFALILASVFLVPAVYALPNYEPFADATGSGGTSYTPGANLGGQINADGLTWADVGTTSTPNGPIKINSGSLTVPGLSPSLGNSILFGGIGYSARMGTVSGVTSSSTLYFSFAIDITDITSLNTSGVFWAGFNNSVGVQATQPTTVGAKIFTRAVSGGFQYGFTKNSTSATSSDVQWETGVTHTVGNVDFLVGSYQFNTATATDDIGKLWINPSSSTFGNNVLEPAANLTSVSADYTSTVASWAFFQRSATEPNSMIADELRLGSDWASVTPAVPEPTVVAFLGLGMLGLVLRYRFGRR